MKQNKFNVTSCMVNQIGSQGFTIPAELRRSLQIGNGDFVRVKLHCRGQERVFDKKVYRGNLHSLMVTIPYTIVKELGMGDYEDLTVELIPLELVPRA